MEIGTILTPVILIIAVISYVLYKHYKEKKDMIKKQETAELNKKLLKRLREDTQKNGLSTLDDLPIILEKEEVCHFYSSIAVDCQIKNMVVGQQSTYNSSSARILRKFGVHSGGSVRQSIRDDVKIETSGAIYLTNKRIIFTASKRSITIPLETIISVDTYCGYIVIQHSKGERLFGVGDQNSDSKLETYMFLVDLEILLNKNLNI